MLILVIPCYSFDLSESGATIAHSIFYDLSVAENAALEIVSKLFYTIIDAFPNTRKRQRPIEVFEQRKRVW